MHIFIRSTCTGIKGMYLYKGLGIYYIVDLNLKITGQEEVVPLRTRIKLKVELLINI